MYLVPVFFSFRCLAPLSLLISCFCLLCRWSPLSLTRRSYHSVPSPPFSLVFVFFRFLYVFFPLLGHHVLPRFLASECVIFSPLLSLPAFCHRSSLFLLASFSAFGWPSQGEQPSILSFSVCVIAPTSRARPSLRAFIPPSFLCAFVHLSIGFCLWPGGRRWAHTHTHAQLAESERAIGVRDGEKQCPKGGGGREI